MAIALGGRSVSNIEVETKYVLDADDFARLKRAGRICRTDNQLNIYYDSGWKLADMAATLRIRITGHGSATMTAKVPVSHTGDRRVMREIDVDLQRDLPAAFRSVHPTSIDVHDLPLEMLLYFSGLGVNRLTRAGWVRNTRIVLDVGAGGIIELDRLELPDCTVVHQAEIETSSESEHVRLSQIVSRFALHAEPSTESKFQLFRRAVQSRRTPPVTRVH